MSSDAETVAALRERISDLEWRLEQHHRELNAVIEQRDKFALSAVWGLLKGVVSSILFVSAIIGSERLIEQTLGWSGPIAWVVSAVIGFIVAVIAVGLMAIYYDRQEEREYSKLWRLPDWPSRDS